MAQPGAVLLCRHRMTWKSAVFAPGIADPHGVDRRGSRRPGVARSHRGNFGAGRAGSESSIPAPRARSSTTCSSTPGAGTQHLQIVAAGSSPAAPGSREFLELQPPPPRVFKEFSVALLMQSRRHPPRHRSRAVLRNLIAMRLKHHDRPQTRQPPESDSCRGMSRPILRNSRSPTDGPGGFRLQPGRRVLPDCSRTRLARVNRGDDSGMGPRSEQAVSWNPTVGADRAWNLRDGVPRHNVPGLVAALLQWRKRVMTSAPAIEPLLLVEEDDGGLLQAEAVIRGLAGRHAKLGMSSVIVRRRRPTPQLQISARQSHRAPGSRKPYLVLLDLKHCRAWTEVRVS